MKKGGSKREMKEGGSKRGMKEGGSKRGMKEGKVKYTCWSRSSHIPTISNFNIKEPTKVPCLKNTYWNICQILLV